MPFLLLIRQAGQLISYQGRYISEEKLSNTGNKKIKKRKFGRNIDNLEKKQRQKLSRLNRKKKKGQEEKET